MRSAHLVFIAFVALLQVSVCSAAALVQKRELPKAQWFTTAPERPSHTPAVQIAERVPEQHTLQALRPLPPLFFKKKGTAARPSDAHFKVLIVTDTHLLDDQTVPGNASNVSRASTEAVRAYLRSERPDFVVHLGDIVSGEDANSTSDVRGAVQQILSPMVQARIPFATTKGNHDNDVYSTHAQITDMEHSYAPGLSYTRKAPKGVGGGDYGSDNYWLPVYAPQLTMQITAQTRPALLLWFFDSRAGHQRHGTNITGVDDWVDASVAPWIQRETASMQKRWRSLPPSLVFVHIPTHAHLTTQTQAPYAAHVGGVVNETIPSHPDQEYVYPGLNVDKPAATQGLESDEDTYKGQDRAFLDALLQSPAGKSRILAITSGHDHGNDWCAPGSEHTSTGQIVPLCYAKHSGFGGYDYDNWNHGARVFDVSTRDLDSGGVRTYIRYLTGETRYNSFLNNRWADQVKS